MILYVTALLTSLCKQALAKIKLPQAKQDLVDARFSRLGGLGRIGRQDKSVFLKRSTMNTADWQHFLEYCDGYAFHGARRALREQLLSSYWGFSKYSSIQEHNTSIRH